MRLALVAVAALVVVASACGGVENDPNLAAAVAETEETGSSGFEIRGFQRDGTRRVPTACEGQADYARKRLEVECDYGDVGKLSMIGIGKTTYLRGAGKLGLGSSDGKWTKFDDGEELARQVSPERLLTMLRAASRQTERVEEEDVRGVATVRYRLDVECAKADQLSCDGMIPVDIWIDDEGLVRRISFEDRAASSTFEFFAFGTPVDIEPPPAGQVVTEEDLETVYGESGIMTQP